MEHVQLKCYSASLVNGVLWELLIRILAGAIKPSQKSYQRVIVIHSRSEFAALAGAVINFSVLNLIASPGTNNVISSPLSARQAVPRQCVVNYARTLHGSKINWLQPTFPNTYYV